MKIGVGPVGVGKLDRLRPANTRRRLEHALAHERVAHASVQRDADARLVQRLEPRDREARERAPPSSRRSPRRRAPSARRGRSSARAGRRRRSARARSVGLKPVMPQHAAGIRIEPPVSVPSAPSASPAASAAAEPPLDPPAVRPGAAGFGTVAVVEVLRGRRRRRTRAGSPCRRRRSPAASSRRTASARLGRDVVGEHRRAVRRAHAGRVEEILDREPPPCRARLELGDEDPV